MSLWAYDMPVSVNKNLAASYILEDPLGRIANDGRVSNLGRVGKKGYVDSRFAVNFDGVDDYGVLATRAINPDGDNTYEFISPSDFAAARTIIAQNFSGTFGAREFHLYTTGSELFILRGGTVTSITTTLKASTLYGLSQVGSQVTLREGGLSGAVVATVTAISGAAREPAAQTIIGARSAGGSYANFFNGLQYNIRINGVLWAMDQRNQTIQPSTPAGNNMTLVNVTSDRWQEVPQ